MSLKKAIKRFIPSPIIVLRQRILDWERLKNEAKLIAAQPDLHKKAVEKVRSKHGPINVVFFALMDSVWKYDLLYQLMEKDERFNPVILVCPVVNYGRENMLLNMDKCYNLFKSRGYNVICSFDKATGQYMDVRKVLNPDVIFYTNPYEGLIDDRYFIKEFRDILTVFVSYAFPNTKHISMGYDLLLHNLVWRRYVEHPLEVIDAKQISRNHGSNIIYSGYPGIDKFIKNEENYSDVWKLKNRKVKRIIWAPHHTITDYAFVSYSTFLDYHDFMLEMAHKYDGQIQIAFKPHPILKNRLDMIWGEDRTLEYYNEWNNLPNGLLNDGAYEDLFMTSDAIIHDSGSFIGEYLYTRKPAMYLSNGRPFSDQYNQLAQKCLDNYYIGRSKEDIENFIINILNGNDPLKEKREAFYCQDLLPPNGKLASENIIDDLVKEIQPIK